jgi:hypothetical protein
MPKVVMNNTRCGRIVVVFDHFLEKRSQVQPG